MIKTEAQETSHASQLPIEENYTNLDVLEFERSISNINRNTGYTFSYPQRWLESPSKNKVVGIRRLDIIPTTHVISLKVTVQNPDDEDVEEEANINLQIMSNNTLLEILTYMCHNLNELLPSYIFDYAYDSTGRLELYCKYKGTTIEHLYDDVNFKIEEPDENPNDKNVIEFAHFLNQDTSDLSYPQGVLQNYSSSKIFNNVWDREYLEFHASFSDSKRRFIGIKGDFYEKPTVLYNSPTDGSTFNIKFTSDGRNPIYPIYCRFIIQLVFMYNYRKTVVL